MIQHWYCLIMNSIENLLGIFYRSFNWKKNSKINFRNKLCAILFEHIRIYYYRGYDSDINNLPTFCIYNSHTACRENRRFKCIFFMKYSIQKSYYRILWHLQLLTIVFILNCIAFFGLGIAAKTMFSTFINGKLKYFMILMINLRTWWGWDFRKCRRWKLLWSIWGIW